MLIGKPVSRSPPPADTPTRAPSISTAAGGLPPASAAAASIHAAREGGDPTRPQDSSPAACFNPRRPRGRRVAGRKRSGLWKSSFNPRRPRGRRPSGSASAQPWTCFNPRRPRGRRQDQRYDVRREQNVSIHAAREGGDETVVVHGHFRSLVSIHAAREGGDNQLAVYLGRGAVSIHAAREGGDAPPESTAVPLPCFNPRRPRGRRPSAAAQCV